MKIPSPRRSRWFAPWSDEWDLAYLGWGVRFYGLYPGVIKAAPNWSIQLVKSGNPILNVGARSLPTAAGDCFVFARGTRQGWTDRGERRSELLTWIWKSPPRSPPCNPPKNGHLHFKVPPLAMRQLIDIHAKCRREVARPDALTGFAIEQLRLQLEICLARINQPESLPPPAAHRLELAIRWMQQNLPVRNPVASLCDYLQVSTSSLERLFFENTGELPASYFHRLKMEHARGFLRQQSMSVKEIAFMLGYTHPNDFTRAFRNFSGKPPRAERKEGDPRSDAPAPPDKPRRASGRRVAGK